MLCLYNGTQANDPKKCWDMHRQFDVIIGKMEAQISAGTVPLATFPIIMRWFLIQIA